jgi:hypothetical protein
VTSPGEPCGVRGGTGIDEQEKHREVEGLPILEV